MQKKLEKEAQILKEETMAEERSSLSDGQLEEVAGGVLRKKANFLPAEFELENKDYKPSYDLSIL